METAKTAKTPIYNQLVMGWMTLDKETLAALAPLALAELALVLVEQENAAFKPEIEIFPPLVSRTAMPSPVSPKKETVSYAVDWTKAPAWAMYHVFAPYRKGYWHKFAPTYDKMAGWEVTNYDGEQGRMAESFFTLPYNGNAIDSLIKRPQAQKGESNINWESAPNWANWHAFDGDGAGWWYASKPVWILNGWNVDRAGNVLCKPSNLQTATPGKWRESLVKRP